MIEIKSALGYMYVMAWRQTAHKLLPEPMLIKMSDALLPHSDTVS